MSMFHISFTADDLKRVVWSILGGAFAGFVGATNGLGPVTNLSTAKAAAVALGTGALAGAFSAVKNLLLADGSKVK